MSDVRHLIKSLKTYVVDWSFSFVPTENIAYEAGIDREGADLDKANVVSSQRRAFPRDRNPQTGEFDLLRHAVLLDIDYPAYLVDSSTPGHHHLYLDVPDGVKHDDYMELLALLGRIGVIEKGYAEVSVARGHSDLRLPWVKKSDQNAHSPGDAVDMVEGTVF